MSRDVEQLVKEMTLEEKAGLCSGASMWCLKNVERLGVPTIKVSDGPHGLRTQGDDVVGMGAHETLKATCFPGACATACSFDPDLLEQMGNYLGEECQAEGVHVLLGPGTNIKRSPLCGRNFEYFSEDPYLAGKMAAAHVRGVQQKGVGTSLKHFAANNQEYRRLSGSSEVDERTLREIYLNPFERVVKEAHPWTLMCSYNAINGVYSSENPWLLTEVLRKEWGFEGVVMSDWGAVNHRAAGVAAGLDLEMPSSNGVNDREIIRAVEQGELTMEELDKTVTRLVQLIFKAVDGKQKAEYDRKKHHEMARQVEEESIVLLKNEDSILPLKKDAQVAFIGEFAEKPRFQGGGSSNINASYITSALKAVEGMENVTYARGYDAAQDEVDETLIAEAVEVAKKAEVAVVFAGLPDIYESEGYDRTHMQLPQGHVELICRVADANPNTVVVLHNGAPVEMPWIYDVKGLLEVYLGGEAVGEATVNILFGDVNPSGKLAESFPLKLEDNPSYLNFPGDGKRVFYKEGIFVGYRYYDTKQMEVLFPFGYGLSYTQFTLSHLHIVKQNQPYLYEVSLEVKNTGNCFGKEVVQLYVGDRTGSASRPVKELKGFQKVALQPGETKQVIFQLDERSFAWYNEGMKDWYAASGEYEIMVGTSSRDMRLKDTIMLESEKEEPLFVEENTVVEELLNHSKTHDFMMEFLLEKMAFSSMAYEEKRMIENFPIRSLKSFTDFDMEAMNAFIEKANTLLRD